jgi:hypothetical protein
MADRGGRPLTAKCQADDPPKMAIIDGRCQSLAAP